MWPFAMAVPIAFRVRIFGARQSEPRELVGACEPHRVVVKRIERRHQPAADRGGARGRELLAADNREPGKAALAPAQRGHAGLFQDRREPRILGDQRGHAGLRSASV